MADSQTGSGNIWDEPEAPCKKKFKKTQQWEYVKETEMPTKRAANGQNWTNLSNKINHVISAYNSKYKIHIHDSTVIQINIWINE